MCMKWLTTKLSVGAASAEAWLECLVTVEVIHPWLIPMHGLPVSEFRPNDTRQAYHFAG